MATTLSSQLTLGGSPPPSNQKLVYSGVTSIDTRMGDSPPRFRSWGVSMNMDESVLYTKDYKDVKWSREHEVARDPPAGVVDKLAWNKSRWAYVYSRDQRREFEAWEHTLSPAFIRYSECPRGGYKSDQFMVTGDVWDRYCSDDYLMSTELRCVFTKDMPSVDRDVLSLSGANGTLYPPISGTWTETPGTVRVRRDKLFCAESVLKAAMENPSTLHLGQRLAVEAQMARILALCDGPVVYGRALLCWITVALTLCTVPSLRTVGKLYKEFRSHEARPAVCSKGGGFMVATAGTYENHAVYSRLRAASLRKVGEVRFSQLKGWCWDEFVCDEHDEEWDCVSDGESDAEVVLGAGVSTSGSESDLESPVKRKRVGNGVKVRDC